MNGKCIIIIDNQRIESIMDEQSFLNLFHQYTQQYPLSTILGQLDDESSCTLGILYQNGREQIKYFYNDFDDYEDDVEIGSRKWMKIFNR